MSKVIGWLSNPKVLYAPNTPPDPHFYGNFAYQLDSAGSGSSNVDVQFAFGDSLSSLLTAAKAAVKASAQTFYSISLADSDVRILEWNISDGL